MGVKRWRMGSLHRATGGESPRCARKVSVTLGAHVNSFPQAFISALESPRACLLVHARIVSVYNTARDAVRSLFVFRAGVLIIFLFHCMLLVYTYVFRALLEGQEFRRDRWLRVLCKDAKPFYVMKTFRRLSDGAFANDWTRMTIIRLY